MPENTYPYELIPLDYPDNALEPFISTETMRVHHNRLLKAYVDRLNSTLKDSPALQRMTIQQLLRNPRTLPQHLRQSIINFGGGVLNHNFFFRTLQPGMPHNMPFGSLSEAINAQFGSFNEFKAQFKEKAMAVFGSGWLWLVLTPQKRLALVPTANQDSPLSLGLKPLMVIDVWEHAYFLQYLNLRAEYIDNFWNVVNWSEAARRYRAST